MPEVTCCKCPPLTEPDSCSLQVKCVQCGHESNTHQAFLDLSLDIRREKSVRNALQVNYCDLSGMLLPRFAALTQIWQSFWDMHGTCLPCMSCRPVRFASRRSSGDCMCRRSALIALLADPSPLAVAPSVRCPRHQAYPRPNLSCTWQYKAPLHQVRIASVDCSCLQRFVGVEYLDGTNKYKCPKHNQKVRAAKQMAIEQAPNVLVLQLKRFEFSAFGHKISEMVSFDLFARCQWLHSCIAARPPPASCWACSTCLAGSLCKIVLVWQILLLQVQYPLELDLDPFMVKHHDGLQHLFCRQPVQKCLHVADLSAAGAVSPGAGSGPFHGQAPWARHHV